MRRYRHPYPPDSVLPAETVYEGSEERAVRVSTGFSPGQVLGALLGVALVVIGAIALYRTGLHFDRLAQTRTSVAGLHHSSALAAGEIVFGLITILTSVITPFAKGMIALLGALSSAAGIVVLADNGSSTDALHRDFSVNNADGWLYLALGVILFLAAIMPTFATEHYSYRADRPILR